MIITPINSNYDINHKDYMYRLLSISVIDFFKVLGYFLGYIW